MANDNKNTNELVLEDDDPTTEFEALADTCGLSDKNDREEPSISQLKSDLRRRSETIDRLQFDIEQLRARWAGLEAEMQARETLTHELNDKLAAAVGRLVDNEKLLQQRDRTISDLEAELRDRPHAHKLAGDVAQAAQQQAGHLACAEAEIGELKEQLRRTEDYADDMRRKLQQQSVMTDKAIESQNLLHRSLDQKAQEAEELERRIADLEQQNAELAAELSGIRDAHAEEIRMIRFELGEAQETVAQQELITEQLASDLVETRGFREELEKMLTRTEEDSQALIEKLERENRRLSDEVAHGREQLQSKSETINCLLAELAKKSRQIESVGDIEYMVHEIDERMSDLSKDRGRRDRERVSRVLIGVVDGQELRFPLFKDRLTIGRTEQNDIQLKANYISRRHAVLVTDNDVTRIIDWGSKNGLFVNSERVTEHFLRNGDKVTIGTAEFRYEERAKRE